MVGFLKKLFSGSAEGDSGSKAAAKSRLHFVLVQDRAGLSSDELARFKKEMIEVIERYFVIDPHAFDVSYKHEQQLTTLQINSPILVRRLESSKRKIEAPQVGPSKGEAKTEVTNPEIKGKDASKSATIPKDENIASAG